MAVSAYSKPNPRDKASMASYFELRGQRLERLSCTSLSVRSLGDTVSADMTLPNLASGDSSF